MRCLKFVTGIIEFFSASIALLVMSAMYGYQVAEWKELLPWFIIAVIVTIRGYKLVCKNERMGGNDQM